MATRFPSKAPRAILSILILASFAVPALLAQAGGPMNGFLKTGDYLLELDGQLVDDASVYRSATAQAVLIVADELPAPVLIRPRFRSVEKVSLLKMNQKQDGSIDLLPNPTYAAEPGFTVDGSDVVFSVEGAEARLKPKPALAGFQPASAIYEHSPEYEQRAGYYTPEASVVDDLRQQSKSVRVQVFFCTWCPACGQMVPRIEDRVRLLRAGARVQRRQRGQAAGHPVGPDGGHLGRRQGGRAADRQRLAQPREGAERSHRLSPIRSRNPTA